MNVLLLPKCKLVANLGRFPNETTKYCSYVTNDVKVSLKKCLDAKLKIIRTREVLRLLVLPAERNALGITFSVF